MEYVYTIFLNSYQSKSISFSPSSPSLSPSLLSLSLSLSSLSLPPSLSLLLSLTELGCPSFSLFSRSTQTVKGVLAYYNTITNTQDTTTRPLATALRKMWPWMNAHSHTNVQYYMCRVSVPILSHSMTLILTLNAYPKFLAAETRAASSGDWALYCSLPEGQRIVRGSEHEKVFMIIISVHVVYFTFFILWW